MAGADQPHRDGDREDEGHDALIAVVIPEVGRRQGQDCDGCQHQNEGQHRIQGDEKMVCRHGVSRLSPMLLGLDGHFGMRVLLSLQTPGHRFHVRARDGESHPPELKGSSRFHPG